jgi:hypothetical protein
MGCKLEMAAYIFRSLALFNNLRSVNLVSELTALQTNALLTETIIIIMLII